MNSSDISNISLTDIEKPKRKLNPWTAEEDNLLRQAVEIYGCGSWKKICTLVPGRSRKQCRERYINTLADNVEKRMWTISEDVYIIRNVNKIGNKWAKICQGLPGRTSNAVKNRYFGHIKRKSLTEEELVSQWQNLKATSVFRPVPNYMYRIIPTAETVVPSSPVKMLNFA